MSDLHEASLAKLEEALAKLEVSDLHEASLAKFEEALTKLEVSYLQGALARHLLPSVALQGRCLLFF